MNTILGAALILIGILGLLKVLPLVVVSILALVVGILVVALGWPAVATRIR